MHARKDCPIAGCGFHKWPPGISRRDLGPVERATYGSPRPKSVRRSLGTDAVAIEIAASEINAAVQRLANELDQQRRGKLDGRQVIADRKRERRKLIGQVARYGMNSL